MSASSCEPVSVMQRRYGSIFEPFFKGVVETKAGPIEPEAVNGRITILNVAEAPSIYLKPLVQTVIDTYKKANSPDINFLTSVSLEVASYALHNWKASQKVLLATRILDSALTGEQGGDLFSASEIKYGLNFGPGIIRGWSMPLIEKDMVDSVMKSTLQFYRRTSTTIKLSSLATTIWNSVVFNNELLYWSATAKIKIATCALDNTLDILSRATPPKIKEKDFIKGKSDGEKIITKCARELLERERFARSEAPQKSLEMDYSSDDEEEVFSDLQSRRNSVEFDGHELQISPVLNATAPSFRFGQPLKAHYAEEMGFEVLSPEDEIKQNETGSREPLQNASHAVRKMSCDNSQLFDNKESDEIGNQLFGSPDANLYRPFDESVYSSEHVDEFGNDDISDIQQNLPTEDGEDVLQNSDHTQMDVGRNQYLCPGCVLL